MITFRQGSLTIRDMQEIDKIENESGLDSKTDSVSPTILFLQSVAVVLSEKWDCVVTVSMAWQVWSAGHHYRSVLQKKHSEMADVAFWYGVDPYKMHPNKVAGLVLNLGRVKCQKRLEENNFDPYDYQGAYDLVMNAYGDEDMALEARSNSLKMLINQGNNSQ